MAVQRPSFQTLPAARTEALPPLQEIHMSKGDKQTRYQSFVPSISGQQQESSPRRGVPEVMRRSLKNKL